MDSPLSIQERKDERRGKDQIILTVYGTEDGSYTYSVQCHLRNLVRAVFPHQVPERYRTPLDARRAAESCLRVWAGNSRALQRRLADFGILSATQLELF